MPKQRSSISTMGIGLELRLHREAAKMSCSDVGERLGISGSTVSRIETGKRQPTSEEVASILAVTGVTGIARERLIEQARGEKDSGLVENSTPTAQSRTYLLLESQACAITNVEPLLVPGLAQTADYASAVMSSTLVTDDDANIEAWVAQRMARQAILTRSKPPMLSLIITESVLRTRLGGPKVMARQVRHLIDLSQRPKVEIRVVPTSIAGHAALDGSFIVLDFSKDPTVVHVEDRTTGLFLDDPAKVDVYRLTVEKLTDVALDTKGSMRLMASIAHDLDRE
jgi:transcriptional regulator with XRE-family HTH domain